jgi:hypothetical protein
VEELHKMYEVSGKSDSLKTYAMMPHTVILARAFSMQSDVTPCSES